MDNSFEKLINRVLDSRYKIENVVGIGGMAYVLKAIDLKQGNRPVAIKILNQEFNSDENAVKRFVNESEAIAMVDSPNIVKIYDVAISESLKYIVMEFVDGITLKDYIDKVGALGWKEAVHYVRQILGALSHAHEKGIIHRDIKPQNVMLLRDGKVKVTDFGIAKTPTSEPLTMTDKAIGTVNYISPEQASGSRVDEKSDLYSVGVMLYEMLTGTLPFKADSPVAVAMMQVSEEPKSPRDINPQIPVGLEQIVIKAMSKDPKSRFGSAASMEKALEFFVKNPNVVFSGVAVNTGATAEARQKRKEMDKEEKREQSIRKHRSMFPIILGVTLSFFTVVILSFVFLWSSFWNDYAENLKASSNGDSTEINGEQVDVRRGIKSIDDLSFVDKMVIFIDYFLGVDGNNSQDREIVIQNYVGEEYTAELRAELEDMGFIIIENRMRKEEDKPYNQILNQDPKGGTEAIDPKAGGRVELTLYINNYSREVYTMPDCRNFGVEKSKAKIKRELSDLFIGEEMIEVREEFNDEIKVGNVIRTEPEIGTVIDTDDIPESIVLYISKGDEPVEKVMPDLYNCTKEEVAVHLENLGIKYTSEEAYSAEVEAGRVVKTSVEAGDTFLSDREIIVYFSAGIIPGAANRIPNCIGMQADEAKATIAMTLGILESRIQVIEVPRDDIPAGEVYNINPPAGVEIANPGSVNIAIYVSKGKEPEALDAIMPEVVYETIETARARLAEAGFKNIIEMPTESNELIGTVINANYTVGAIIKENVNIVLYVSTGIPDGAGASMDALMGEAGHN